MAKLSGSSKVKTAPASQEGRSGETKSKNFAFKGSRKRDVSRADQNKGPGALAQIKQVVAQTRAHDPQFWLWVGGAFAIVFLLFLIIGFVVGHPIYLGIIGFMLGLVAAMFVLGRRAEKAAYASIAGQPGATGAVLSSLRKGWRVEQEPVAAEMGRNRQVRDLSSAAMVFRAVGRAGVVLLAEGPKGAASKLLEAERRRTSRVLGPEVPVHLIRVGQGEGATDVNAVTKEMQKLPKVLTDDEVGQVTKRLRALGPNRPAVPAGIDPNKVRTNRAAMRGR